MNINFEIHGNSFLSGAIIGLVIVSHLSAWWCLLAILPLLSIEKRGWWWGKLNYKSGQGWKLSKGQYK